MASSSFLIVILSTMSVYRSSATLHSFDWDHFVVAQQWPMTSCIEANNITHEHDCRIPNNVSTWTMHGVWPSMGTSTGPAFCNVSDPDLDFDPDSLSPILPQMVKFWPNLYKDTGFYSFWKHEWCKHGTCAASQSDIDSELKYFSKGLQLQTTFNLLSILHDANIKPSDDTTYQYSEFVDALKQGLGVEPKLSCVYDKETQAQYVAQIEFCISKKFELIDCPKRHPHLSPPETMNFSPYDRIKYGRMMAQKRMRRAPETCQQFLRSHPIVQSQCRDTENLVYPKIKY